MIVETDIMVEIGVIVGSDIVVLVEVMTVDGIVEREVTVEVDIVRKTVGIVALVMVAEVMTVTVPVDQSFVMNVKSMDIKPDIVQKYNATSAYLRATWQLIATRGIKLKIGIVKALKGK